MGTITEINWRLRAACREIGGDIFYPEPGDSIARIKAICASCPVRVECLQDALDTTDVEFGIRGGLSAHARRKLLRQRRRDEAAAWVAQQTTAA